MAEFSAAPEQAGSRVSLTAKGLAHIAIVEAQVLTDKQAEERPWDTGEFQPSPNDVVLATLDQYS